MIVTRLGLDAHDRGSRIVAAYLRDAGMEVVYTEPWMKVDGLVSLVLEEDADVIGISSLATDHLLVPALMRELAEQGLGHVRVVLGGIIPDADEPMLLAAGVARVLHPGSSREEIVGAIEEQVGAARAKEIPPRSPLFQRGEEEPLPSQDSD